MTDRERQVKDCIAVFEAFEASWNPLKIFSIHGKLEIYAEDVQDEARLLWIRKKRSHLYEAINSLAGNLKVLCWETLNSRSAAIFMPIYACSIAYVAIKCDPKYDNKTKTEVGDLCRLVLKNHVPNESIDDCYELMHKTIDLMRGIRSQEEFKIRMASSIKRFAGIAGDNGLSEDKVMSFIPIIISEVEKSSFRE